MDDGSDVNDSTTSASSTNNQDAQILLTIPGKLILDSMLRQLGLPTAIYRRRVYQDHKTCVTVVFHPSRLSYDSLFLPMSISGVGCMDISVAEHSVAIEAIRYIESVGNTVVKDLNYGRLRQLEEENELLSEKLKSANIRAEKLARSWFLCVRHMSSFSDQFHNMAILSYFGGQEVITDSMKAAFQNIEGIAQRLESVGGYLETKLEGIRRSTVGHISRTSSGPVLSVNNKCILPSTINDNIDCCRIPRVVKVPSKLMLDTILDALGYPKARYDFHIDEHAQVSATVTFRTSAHSSGSLIRPIKIASDLVDDSTKAAESVAREGIRYMETWENLEVEDLHYGELGHVRQVENDLLKQLQAVETDKANFQKGLLCAAEEMFSFSHKISDLAANNNYLGQGDEAEAINMILERFQEVASNLTYAARQVQKGAGICTGE